MAVLSNGGNIVNKAVDGSLEFAWNEPDAVTALQWTVDFYKRNRKESINPKEMNDWDGDIIPFSKGTNTFILYPTWAGTNQLKDWPAMEVARYGWMPFPKGPNGKAYSCYFSQMQVICVPINTEDPEITGVVMNELFDVLDGYSKTDIYSEISRNIFHSETDYKIYLDVIKNGRYNYYVQLPLIGGANISRDFGNKTCINGSQSVSEYLSSITDKIQTGLDSYTEKYVTSEE
jgi:hypothetical protein